MTPTNTVIAAAIGYALFLFLIAFISDRRDRPRWLSSPVVYTLSISVYCTSWTFFGAVGSATRNGLEFVTIYLGPTLVFLGFYTVLRKLLRIRREDNITSIADLISTRYGKSGPVAAIVTLIAVAGAAPYIALQLKAITTSFHVIGAASVADLSGAPAGDPHFITAFWVAAGLALFTILFGTRSIDANERHYGVVAAIAVEALVKLVALIGVGLLAVYAVADGPQDIFARIAQTIPPPEETFGARWIGLILLSAAAVICLPRQFQVTVVENIDERHLYTAAWMFPLYLFLMSLFILPIAAVGATALPEGSNPDMFVLTMPIAAGRDDIAMLAFLGGFSSATSMVIVSCIALSTMISNHIVMPVALRAGFVSLEAGGDLRNFVLRSRRIAILVILLFGFLYLRLGPTGAGLASIGLVAFAGVAQVVPALIGALYWPGANGRGALLGLCAGFAVWLYTLLLPGLLADAAWWQAVSESGPFGIASLRPSALFGLSAPDPLMHALFWSLGLNTLLFVLGSLSRSPRPMEQVQSALFVDAFRRGGEGVQTLVGRVVSADALFDLAQRIMGANTAYGIFRSYARRQKADGDFPEPDDAFIDHLERRMAASVGGATARAMISRVAQGERVSLDELVRIADETARLMEYSMRLEQKSAELEETATQLRAANERLRELDAQKDDFLSQISHELRTPMTSIRSFAEILSSDSQVAPEQRAKFISIIHDDSIRLTGLLDEILDMGIIEREDDLPQTPVNPEAALTRAIDTCRGLAASAHVRIERQGLEVPVTVRADSNRLSQVFINIISNSIKYNTMDAPIVRVISLQEDGNYVVDICDNGPGIAPEDSSRIFEKFTRGSNRSDEKGAGLGLAISRAIMRKLGGDVVLAPSGGSGARFVVTIPVSETA